MGVVDFLLSCCGLIDKRLTVKLDFVHCDVGAQRRHHNGQSRVLVGAIEMFCPKCGVQIVETTKFCKSCGLALAPVTDFVASGGASPLGASSWTNAFSGFSPTQKMWLMILTLIFSPILLGALPFFVPVAIVWMVLRHSEQKRYLAASTAVQPGYFQQTQIQPAPTNPLSESRSSAQQPVLQTGSLISGATPGSVVEDETRRLRNQ
jgi:hypothetical protein